MATAQLTSVARPPGGGTARVPSSPPGDAGHHTFTTVEFLDELPDGRTKISRNELAVFVRSLRRHPGEWAAYPAPLSLGSAKSRASDINCGRVASVRAFAPTDDFEAAVRDGVLYVRFVGVG